MAVDVSDSSKTPAAHERDTAPDAVAPPPGNPRFPLFDGMRAIAALSVLVYHVGFVSGASVSTALTARLLAQLNVGVAVFFVISGFLLYRPMLAARAGIGPPVRVRDFARRRVLRIVPGYWVALTVLTIVIGLPDVFSPHWWVYYGFLQDYQGVRVIFGIGSAWTLGCEVVFYALLPFISFALAAVAARATGRRLWWRFELIALVVASVLSALYRVLANGHHTVLAVNTFPASFAWFAFGMILALGSVVVASERPELFDRARRYASVGWPAALVVYLILCFGLRYDVNPFVERDSAGHIIAWYALDGIVAFCLAAPAVFVGAKRTWTDRLLAWRPLAWIGLVSYAVYLYHNPLLTWLNSNVTLAHGHARERFVILLILIVPLVLAVAALSYYIVERPFLRLKEVRFFKSRAARAG